MQTSSLLDDLTLRRPQRRIVSLSAPWGARIPSGGGRPGIYLVGSGSAVLSSEGREPIVLEAGDVAVLPQGHPHVIASRQDAEIQSVEEFSATATEVSGDLLVGGRGGAATELRTLCFDVEGTRARAILAFAPRVVVVRTQDASPWFANITRATLDLLEAAVREPELAERRLGELLVLEALAGNVLAIGSELDPPVLKAALLLRSELSTKWTVGALARRVGLGRSALYDRFVRGLGCPPSAYLFRARMEQAAVLLATGHSIDDVASGLGYVWSSSFTVAFQRFHGVAPSTYKKSRQDSGGPSSSA